MAVGSSSRAAKSAPKATAKASAAKTKTVKPPSKTVGTHPSWKDLIKECITNSESARSGVSRVILKKYAEDTYKINMTPLQVSQLNRAIISGEKLGIFSLPKGPSGKVKLAPKTKPVPTKENAEAAAPVKKTPAKVVKAAPKPKPAVTKKKVVAKKSAAATTASKVTKKTASSSSRPGKKAAVAKVTKAKAAKAKAAPKPRGKKATA
ncbi:hypothetical protein NLI96_g9579 [Meripilus lineatus]|uniref:Histone H1 n=1 Tax=Meripilus lineatus TaxID=2056292 RepID=A0AAD5UV65_9APHY|nr:hypothetical protein NLI96_g9579 [Physisporinus lineatus]